MRCRGKILGVARPNIQYLAGKRIVIPYLLIGLDRDLPVNICGSIDIFVCQQLSIKTFVKINVVNNFSGIPVDHGHNIEIITVEVESFVVDLIRRRHLIPAAGVNDIVFIISTC